MNLTVNVSNLRPYATTFSSFKPTKQQGQCALFSENPLQITLWLRENHFQKVYNRCYPYLLKAAYFDWIVFTQNRSSHFSFSPRDMNADLNSIYLPLKREQAYELLDFVVMAAFGLFMMTFSIFICFLIIFKYRVSVKIPYPTYILDG